MANPSPRNPKDIAEAIRHFPVAKRDPSQPRAADDETFETMVSEAYIRDIGAELEDMDPEGTTPIDRIGQHLGKYKLLLKALESIANGKPLSQAQKTALQDAPVLVGYLIAHNSQAVAKSASASIERPEHFIDKWINSVMGESREESSDTAINLHRHIMPLFRELASALKISLNEGLAKGAS